MILDLESWAGLTETLEVTQTLCCSFNAQVITGMSELKDLLIVRGSKHTGDKLTEYFCEAWVVCRARAIF